MENVAEHESRERKIFCVNARNRKNEKDPDFS